MDQTPLKNSDVLILCGLIQTPLRSPDSMIGEFCSHCGMSHFVHEIIFAIFSLLSNIPINKLNNILCTVIIMAFAFNVIICSNVHWLALWFREPQVAG